MSSGIFPAFSGSSAETVATLPRAVLTVVVPAHRPLKPFDVFQRDLFNQRVRTFLQSLPTSQRAEIATRARFRSIPWIRRADERDDNDYLP